MTALPNADIEQTVYDRQRPPRVITAVRTLRPEPAVYRALREAGLPITPPRMSEALTHDWTPILPEGHKRCAICEDVKPLTEFYVSGGKPQAYCIPCKREYEREARELRRAAHAHILKVVQEARR